MKKFLSTLLYTAAATLLFSACGMTANTVSSPVEPTVKSNEKTAVNNKALVYFSKDISPVSLIKLYDKINQDIHGKVAIYQNPYRRKERSQYTPTGNSDGFAAACT